MCGGCVEGPAVHPQPGWHSYIFVLLFRRDVNSKARAPGEFRVKVGRSGAGIFACAPPSSRDFRSAKDSILTVVKEKKSAAQFTRYIGPVIQAIRVLGGSGRPEEVPAVVAKNLQISDAEQSDPLPSGVQTRFENQMHWARFYLAKAGYIDSSQRGVWTLTEKGARSATCRQIRSD